MRARHFGILTLILLLPGFTANANDDAEQTSDIWIKAKIMTTYALNEYLSPFAIIVHLNRGTATLTGSVANNIESDLAKRIAEGVKGVEKVDNRLNIDPNAQRNTAQSSFLRFVEDANTAARIKSRPLSPNARGPKIRATNKNGVVFLEG